MVGTWGGRAGGTGGEKCGLGVSPAWVRSMVGKPDRTNSASGAPFQDRLGDWEIRFCAVITILVVFYNS